MTNPAPTHDDNFRALALAAMRCATGMLAELRPDTLEGVEAATRAGARLVLEFGPLPGFESVQLVLLEREGRRHTVASIAVNPGPLQ